MNKKLLSTLLLCVFFSLTAFTQYLETFETQTNNASSFTSNGQTFNITYPSTYQFFIEGSYPGTGWNGTANDNKYIDNSGYSFAGVNINFSIKTNNADTFNVESLWVFLSDHALNQTLGGSMTVTGKRGGVTIFTASSSTGFNTSTATNNGFTKIDLTTYGGTDNTKKNIDELNITTTGSYEYIGLDALTWSYALASGSSQTNITCNGSCNGSATVSPSGGTGSYSYSWAPSGGTTATASSLCFGTYTCTIKDGGLRQITKTVTITQPSAISHSISSQTNVSCNGGSNGAAVITASGGTGSLTYAWSPAPGAGQGTTSVTGLSNNTYTCTITDANSCTTTQTVSITQPTAISHSITSKTNVSCNGGSNGAAVISASGGTGSLTYAWSPAPGAGQGTVSVTGLSNNTYTCTITDANSCTTTQTVSITQPSAITHSISSQTNVACNGGSNGAATVSASGGTGSLTYAWAPSGGNAASASGLTAGSYTCTITDANSCSTTQAVSITEPTAISASVSSQTNVSCNAGSDGTITVSASGGTGSLSYAWAPSGGNAASASGLAAGSYTCTITDANSCSTTQSATITEPAPITYTQNPTICNGQSVTVGANTYTSTGSYSDVLTAANGCDSSVTTNLTVNPLPVISSQSGTITVCSGDSGLFTVTSAGSNTYQWYWVNVNTPGTITADIGIYSENNYTTDSMTINPITNAGWGPSGLYGVLCIVTNGSGCTSTSLVDTIFINPLPTISITGNSSVTIGTADTLTATGAVSYVWTSGSTSDTTIVTPLANTTYTVTGTDANGCHDTASFVVTVNPLGLNNIYSNDKMSLFPNPAVDYINLSFTMNTANSSSVIKVYDMLGNEMMSENETIGNGKTVTMNISSLSNGVYFIKVLNGKKEQVVRFIKQ